MFTGFYTTNTGHSYIAKAVAGKSLVLTKGQFGDGALPTDVSITSVTELIAPLGDMPISKQSPMKNCVTITTPFSNKVNGSIIPPFNFMEAGLWGKVTNEDGSDDEDAPEALLFYANALSAEKADYIPGVLTEYILNWPLTISEASSVTVEINKSLVYPTMEEFNERTSLKITAEGTGSEITVTTGNDTLSDGQQLTITLPEDLKAGATISCDGGESYPIYNANGTPVTEGQQKEGTALNVIFNEEQKRWYIIGGGSVEIASQAEAVAGTDNTKMMTPLRVSNYVDKILGDINIILDSINGEVI